MQGFEICRLFNLAPKELPENDIKRMDMLLWKWKKTWEVKFDSLREKHGEEPFNVNGDDILGDLRDWEQFAEDNYDARLPDYSMAMVFVPWLLMLFKGV